MYSTADYAWIAENGKLLIAVFAAVTDWLFRRILFEWVFRKSKIPTEGDWSHVVIPCPDMMEYTALLVTVSWIVQSRV